MLNAGFDDNGLEFRLPRNIHALTFTIHCIIAHWPLAYGLCSSYVVH